MNEYRHAYIDKFVITADLDINQFIAIFVVSPSLCNYQTIFLLGVELELLSDFKIRFGQNKRLVKSEQNSCFVWLFT